VAVSTQGLQISRIIVATVSVYVVYVELTAMFGNESAMLTGIFLVDGIWILVLLDVSFIDSPAAKATSGS
jgi:DMSO/TMAO reductase YedYZ heme-binding membrane subunit